MNPFKIIAGIVFMSVTTLSHAWNSDNTYGGNSMSHFNTNFSFGMNMQGNSNASSQNNGYGSNAFAPIYQPRNIVPLTAEEMKEQRTRFETAQREAYERHLQALKNRQTTSRTFPRFGPSAEEIKARHEAYIRAAETQRKAAQKRHKEMMQKYNEARGVTTIHQNS